MCPCGWLVHVASLCVIDNVSECFPSTKDLGGISPSHVEPAIIVCVFPILKAAFMLCSVLLEVSTIPVPPVPTWIIDQCYRFKNRSAVKCRSDTDLNQRVFSCPLFLPQSARFIERLTDEGSIIAWMWCYDHAVVSKRESVRPHLHLSHFDWSPLKKDRNWLWKYSKHKPDLSPRRSNGAWTHLEQLSSGSCVFTDLRCSL